MDYYDVLIIGAGPAGSRVACRLAGLGYKTAVLEKHQAVGDDICCTGIVSRECGELFHIPQACILQAANSAKLFAPSGEFLSLHKDETQAYILDRAAFDLSLAESAEKQGAEYLLGTRAKDISIRDEGVEVLAAQRGETLTLRAKVAIIANGFDSKLPQKLGLGQMKDFIIGAQTEVETNGISEVEVHFSQRIAHGFFAWLAPLSPNRARAGLFSRDHPGNSLRQFLTELQAQGKISPAKFTITYGGIPLRPLPLTYGERILVVGDAAGQVKPTTGGGIYYGLLCADMAAAAIHEAFGANDFSRTKLVHYENAWKGELGGQLRMGGFARRLYNRLSDRRINQIFHIVRERNIHHSLLHSPHFSFDQHGLLILEGLKHLGHWRHFFTR